jgi:N-acetylmuramoyl-L-alanine amidase
MKIAIDAGHGINTAGKRTPDDIREWTLNNRVLLGFKSEIDKYQNVSTVRTDDPTGKTDVPLTTRTNKAKQEKCDIFISFHHNAYQSKWGTHTGSEAWVYPNRKSETLAKALLDAVVKETGLRNRGVKTGNFHVNREVPFPSVLVEVGFMDSTIDHPIITNPKVSERVGVAMAKAIADLYKLKLKEIKPTPTPTPKGDKAIIQKGAKYRSLSKTYDGKTVPSGMIGKEYNYKLNQVKGKDWVYIVELNSYVDLKSVKFTQAKPQTPKDEYVTVGGKHTLYKASTGSSHYGTKVQSLKSRKMKVLNRENGRVQVYSKGVGVFDVDSFWVVL